MEAEAETFHGTPLYHCYTLIVYHSFVRDMTHSFKLSLCCRVLQCVLQCVAVCVAVRGLECVDIHTMVE